MTTKTYHGQLAYVNNNGNVTIFYPKTFSKDIYVNSNKKTLETFLGDTSSTGIGDGTITGSISSINTTSLNNTSAIAGKAPINHASTGTGYGMGNASNYGHVKVSDNYASSAGGASSGVIASSQAISNHWYSMGTYGSDGNGFGTNYKLYCRHNVKGDGRFYIGVEGGQTNVDYVSRATKSGSAQNVTSISNAIKYATTVINTDVNGNANLGLALSHGGGNYAVLLAEEKNGVYDPGDGSRICVIPFPNNDSATWWVHCVWGKYKFPSVPNGYLGIGYWYIAK